VGVWCGWWSAGDRRLEVGFVGCEEGGVEKVWWAVAALVVESVVLVWVVGADVWEWSAGVVFGR